MGKFGCFQHVLCHNSAIFEDIDLKFYTHIHQPLPSNILHAFLKTLFLRGKCFRAGLRADFFKMCRIVAGRGTANFKAKFSVLQKLFAKPTVGIKMTSH